MNVEAASMLASAKQGTVPVSDPNAAASAKTATTDNTATPSETPAEKAQKAEKAKDPDAGYRYQISKERERAEKAEARAKELEAQLKTPPPTFTQENDPDGKKERQYEIEKGIKEGMAAYAKELGLGETLEQIQFEREQDKFFSSFEEIKPQFEKLGIDAPSKDEIKTTLEKLDKQGITREQVYLLSKMEKVLSLLKPQGFAPGDGGKPEADGKDLTQRQKWDRIYAAQGVKW